MSEKLEIDAKKLGESRSGRASIYDLGLPEPKWIPNSVCEDCGNDKLEVSVWWLEQNAPELL